MLLVPALVLLIDGAERLVPRAAVVEVAALGYLTPVPTAPPALAGLTQLRGQILPVLDLAAAEQTRLPRPGAPLLVVELPELGRAALLIDEARGEAQIADDDPRLLDLYLLGAAVRDQVAARALALFTGR